MTYIEKLKSLKGKYLILGDSKVMTTIIGRASVFRVSDKKPLIKKTYFQLDEIHDDYVVLMDSKGLSYHIPLLHIVIAE